MILDFSESMEDQAKKRISVKTITDIIELYMKDDDRLGFLTFN